ncbi:hypothetical protein TURU_068359 [Turdus rufiventris]|nr:hypothetical protein TURU_068359 [Turdus rufiventris]
MLSSNYFYVPTDVNNFDETKIPPDFLQGSCYNLEIILLYKILEKDDKEEQCHSGDDALNKNELAKNNTGKIKSTAIHQLT